MSIWKELYQAYEEKNCDKFKKLWKNLTEEDKKSLYFSKYQSLYSKLCPPSDKKWKILLKWKVIKCPHCGSWISKSEFNLESIKKLKKWIKQIDFVCNYCGTKFTWSKKPFKSIFSDYSVGKKIEIDLIEYKIAWWVKYKGKYYEEGSWWILEYIEWLAYDEKWEIYYIAESRAKDDEWVYDSLEMSKKVSFPFLIKKYDSRKIYVENGSYSVKEVDDVEVVEVYGEVNKWYKIWEKVKIYNFDDYSLEIEKTENGVERNLYKKAWINNITNNNWSISSYIFFIIVWLFIIFPFTKNMTIDLLYNSKINIWHTKMQKIEFTKKRWEFSEKDLSIWSYKYIFYKPIASKDFYEERYDNWWKDYRNIWKRFSKLILIWFKFSILNNKDKKAFITFLKQPNMINSFAKNKYVSIILENKKIEIHENDLIIKLK